MNCPKCGFAFDDGTRFCPRCGAAVQRKAARKPKKNLTAPIIAAVVAVAMIVTGVCFWAFRSGDPVSPEKKKATDSQSAEGKKSSFDQSVSIENNVFALKLKSAREGTTSYETLNACSALYNTLFNTTGFSLRFTADDIHDKAVAVDGGFAFGSDLLSTQALYDDGSVCVALRNGKLLLRTEEIEATQFDVSSILNDMPGLVEAIPDKYLPAAAKTILANNADTIRLQIRDLFDDSLDPSSLNQLSDYLYRVLYLIKSTKLSEYLTGNDSVLVQDLFNIVAEFAAQLPENVIEIETTEDGDELRYAFRFRRTEFEKSVLSFVLSSDKIGALLTDKARSDLEDSLEKLMPYDENPITGEIVIRDNYVVKIAAGEDYKGNYFESFCLTFDDMNGSSAASAMLDEVFASVEEDEVSLVTTAEELKELFRVHGSGYEDGFDDSAYDGFDDFSVDEDDVYDYYYDYY